MSKMSQVVDDMVIKSDIARFYDNRTVFITGSTGFMGKVLVEKLLRSTNVKRIYVLIRPKRGASIQTRLEELLAAKLFDRVRDERPHMMGRVVSVAGDITQNNLGISAQDERLLASEVSVLFHSAATVKFDEDFTKSVALNVEAVQSIINLAKQMVNLEALVHVSTAYCNCDQQMIEEKVYEPPGNPLGMIQLCKLLPEESLNSPEMTAKLIGNRPNTYTFTKALAENLLMSEGKGLPIAIVRPSIVSAGWQEPIAGWVDNLNGATGVLAGASKGILRTLWCRRDMVADIVPVDVPINLLCTVAWKVASEAGNNNARNQIDKDFEIKVYNCTTGQINPIRWGDIEAWGYDSLIKFPSSQMFWFPGGSMKSSETAHRICQVLFHQLPAHLADLIFRLMGRKPFLVKLSLKMNRALKALEYFTTNDWQWTNENTQGLVREMSASDREVFEFDVKKIVWPDYIDNYIRGVRQFVFKEGPESLNEARKALKRMYWLDKFVQIMVFVMFWRVVFGRSEIAGQMWSMMLNLMVRFFRLLPVDSQ